MLEIYLKFQCCLLWLFKIVINLKKSKEKFTCLNSAISRSCLFTLSTVVRVELFFMLPESLFFKIPLVAVPTTSKSINIFYYLYLTYPNI